MTEKNRKHNVVFLVNSGGFSGAESVVLKIIRNLKKDYKFYYASESGSVNEFLKEEEVDHIIIKKVSIRTVRQIEREYHPDIFHVLDYKASVICALSYLKTPFVSHLHSSSLWLDKFHPYSFAYLYAALKSGEILTVSDSIERRYIFSGFIRNKIHCISNPVCGMDILKKCNINQKKQFDICFTGRISIEKNPFLFLEIIKKIKNQFDHLKVVMIGDGPLFEEVSQKIKEDGMSDYVTLAGYQKNPYDLMVRSKVFLLPSKYEGYPLVIIEALTLGLPCVVSDVGGLRMILTKECGFICTSEEDYQKSLKMLLENEEQYKIYSEEAKKRAKILENNAKYMKQIDLIYKKILGV